MRNVYKISARKTRRKEHLADQGVDGKIMLKCILDKEGVRVKYFMGGYELLKKDIYYNNN
jgi:hypothetical protein